MKDKIEISRAAVFKWVERNFGGCMLSLEWSDLVMEAEKERATYSSIEAETGDHPDDKTPEFGGTASGPYDLVSIFHDMQTEMTIVKVLSDRAEIQDLLDAWRNNLEVAKRQLGQRSG